MAKTARVRLGVGTPIVREYPISSFQDFDDKVTGQNVSVCKYLKAQKTGQKDQDGNDIWEDKVFKEFVQNPDRIDLRGSSIKVTTEIV